MYSSIKFRSIALYLTLIALLTITAHREPISSVEACTVAYHAPSTVMLKSYDWDDGEGYVYFNPRGRQRVAFSTHLLDPKASSSAPSSQLTAKWTSTFASLSFNQYGRGFPNGGINERGLAIEVLWLPESIPQRPNSLPYLNELEWIQYHLDRSADLPSLISASQKLRIVPIHGAVHYFACDRQARCATIELIKGELVIHSGDELPQPALTNHTYDASIEYSEAFIPFGGDTKFNGARGSLDRFVHASIFAQSSQAITAKEALNKLDRVKINGYTKWQISYDLKALSIRFKTPHQQEAREVHLKPLLSTHPQCIAPLSYGLHEEGRGDVNDRFHSITKSVERSHLQARLKMLKLPKRLATLLADHPAGCASKK